MGFEHRGDDEPSPRVHVRRLTVTDTLRWSWVVLRRRPKLLGVAFAVNALSVAAAFGVSQPSASASPEIPDWVLALYLGQFLAVLVASGVFYLTAAEEVANEFRAFAPRLVASIRRLPAFVGTIVVTVLLAGLSLIPSVVLRSLGWPLNAVGLLLTLPAVYVFLRLLPAYPASVVDRLGPIESARAGWRAASGIVWKVFAVGVVYVVTTVASSLVSGLFGGQYDVASTLVSAAIGAVLFPFFGLALAHLYLEGSRNR